MNQTVYILDDYGERPQDLAFALDRDHRFRYVVTPLQHISDLEDEQELTYEVMGHLSERRHDDSEDEDEQDFGTPVYPQVPDQARRAREIIELKWVCLLH